MGYPDPVRISITGATGFLGSHLTEVLSRHHDVVGVVRTPSKGAHLDVELRKADLTDKSSLVDAFRGSDVLIANAALAPGWKKPTPQAYLDANITGARNQLEAAAEAGVSRVIWISTVGVYRTRLFRALREDAEKIDPHEPRFDWNNLTTDSGYTRSKAAAELLAWELSASLGLDVTALRPGPIYGERDPKLTARYFRMARWPIALAPTTRLPHVHASDVALAAHGALENPESIGRAYNVTGASVSVFSILRSLRRAGAGRQFIVPLFAPLRIAFDDGAAERDLGFRPRSFDDAARDLVRERGSTAR